MFFADRSYEQVLVQVQRNLDRYQIPAEKVEYFRSLCRHEGHLEQVVKEDGEVVILCDLCGMDTFL